MSKSFEKKLQLSIDPIQKEVTTLSGRVAALEAASSFSSNDVMYDPHDPAFRQVSLVGFADETSFELRLQEVEKFLAKYPGHRSLHFDANYKGPRNKRVLGNSCFVEFSSSDAANNLFERAKGYQTTVDSKLIKVKMGITKFNKARNWALLKAKDLCGNGAIADMKARTVSQGDVVCFEQEKNESKGTFCGPCSHLRLP